MLSYNIVILLSIISYLLKDSIVAIAIATTNHHHEGMFLHENHMMMNMLMNSKERTVSPMHANNQIVSQGTSAGWASAKMYLSDTSCDDSHLSIVYGVATNICVAFQIEGYPEKLSVIVTCNSASATGVFYNGTNCNPSNKIQTDEVLSIPMGVCYPIPTIPSQLSNKLVVGLNRTEFTCSASSTISLPTNYDWTLNSDFFVNDTTCAQQVTYSAFRNAQCFTYASSYGGSYSYTYPNVYDYYGANCKQTPYIFPLVTSCQPYTSTKYLDKYYSTFVSNTVNPISSFLSFSSNITLAGLTTPTLASSAQLAVLNATATSMQLPMSDIIYGGSASAPPASISTNMIISNIYLVKEEESKHVDTQGTTYSLIAETKTMVSIPSSQNPTTAYNQYTTSLTSAVKGNAYTQSLQSASKAYGATATATASATGVTSSSATIQSVSTDSGSSSSSSNGLSGGAIAGIVIGVIVGLALMTGIGYYIFFVLMHSSSSLASQATATAVVK